VINLVKKVAQNVDISLDYYIFLQLEASKSSPIDEKSPNLVTLLASIGNSLETAGSYSNSS
jgi:hypothetical protein